MANLQVTKQLHFCCAHRLGPDMGMCHNIHGHNYRVDLTIEPMSLPDGPSGSVLDFKEIKEKCQGHLDSFYDHRLLLKRTDSLIDLLRDTGIEIMVVPEYPTAEWMAKHFLVAFGNVLPDNIRVASVVVWETDSAYAKAVR